MDIEYFQNIEKKIAFAYPNPGLHCLRKVDLAENMSIVAWVSLQSNNQDILRYLRMQCIKKCSTNRVGPKGDGHAPGVEAASQGD